MSLIRPPRQPLSRAKARNCALINQLGTPGLGSVMGGRIWVGIGQLTLAVAGFLMVAGWFIQLCFDAFRFLKGIAAGPLPFPWLGPAGAITFLAAWLWSLVTSLSLLREARRNDGVKPAG